MAVNEHYTPQEIFEKVGDLNNEENFRVENKLLREMYVAAKLVTHLTGVKISAASEPNDVQVHFSGSFIGFQVVSFFGLQRNNGILQVRRPHQEYKKKTHPKLLTGEDISDKLFEEIDNAIDKKREKRYNEPINLLLYISYPNFWLLQNNFEKFVKKMFIILKEGWLRSISIIWGNEILCFPGKEKSLQYISNESDRAGIFQGEHHIYFCPLVIN